MKYVKIASYEAEKGKIKKVLLFFSGGLDAVLPFKNTIFFTGVAPETLSLAERRIGILSKLVVVNDPAHIRVWNQLGARQTICLPISAIDPDDYPKKMAKIVLNGKLWY